MNASDFQDIHDIRSSRDLDEHIEYAQRKRVIYPWNDWGNPLSNGGLRMPYAELTSGSATLIDYWPDPAFNQDGDPQLWLRAEVWRHPGGTYYRALLHASGTSLSSHWNAACRQLQRTRANVPRRPTQTAG